MIDDQPEWIIPEQPSSRVIISAGIGSHHYRKMLRSTENHCAVHCADTTRMFFDVLPTGARAHIEDPYGFKIHALRRAIDPGYQNVLWMDATCQPVESIEPLWEQLKEFGFYVVKQEGAMLGSWVSDYALGIFGITRDQAMDIPLVYTGLVGLNMRSLAGVQIWTEWCRLYKRCAFVGPHFNEPGYGWPWMEDGAKWRGHCSFDPRCEGHRHDESAMSFVLWKLGLKPAENPRGLAHYGIERHVPDYDVVKMQKLLANCDEWDIGIPEDERDALCR